MSDQGEWVLINLDEKAARRQGIPAGMPVPRKDFEGLAEKGLSIDLARKWIKDFLTNSPAGKDGAWRKKNHKMVVALEAFLDKAPLWDRAQKAFAENDYEKAMSALKRIASMDPDDHAARLNLASAQANGGDYAGALKNFQAIRKTFEGDSDFHVSVGHVHLALQQNDPALEEFVLALEANPQNQAALDALLKLGILTAIYENPRDAASLTYVRSDAVRSYLETVWDAEPRDLDYYLEQLSYHEQDGRPDVALAAAERALKASGDAGSERAVLAHVAALRSLGRTEEATAAVRSYLEKTPTSAGAYVELAKCLAAEGKAEEGRAEIDRALEADPGDLQALQFRFWPGKADDIEKVNGAIPALKEFAEAHASSPGVWRSLARALDVVGRHDDAIETIARAVALVPEDDEVRAEYWSFLGKQGRFEEILADAAKITDMAKRNWKLRWNEAEAYSGLGKMMEARAAFSAINFDESLHVDIRKRAKRAVKGFDEAAAPPAAAPAAPEPAAT
jgi:tetratricopeptide (TPR) repeat protein